MSRVGSCVRPSTLSRPPAQTGGAFRSKAVDQFFSSTEHQRGCRAGGISQIRGLVGPLRTPCHGGELRGVSRGTRSVVRNKRIRCSMVSRLAAAGIEGEGCARPTRVCPLGVVHRLVVSIAHYVGRFAYRAVRAGTTTSGMDSFSRGQSTSRSPNKKHRLLSLYSFLP